MQAAQTIPNFKNMLSGGRLAILAVASLLASMLVVVPASAHRESSKHGADVGGVDGKHLSVYACDNEKDGHGVRTEYVTWGGGSNKVGDANGSKAGCGSEITYDGWEIRAFRVCEETKGCTKWNYTK